MNIIPFIQIKKEDLPLVGQKGLSLGEMESAKFEVPDGYIVTSKAFDDFLAANKLNSTIRTEVDKININDIHSVDYASRVLADLIQSTEIDPHLSMEILQQFTHINADFAAVRSSVYSEDNKITSLAGDMPTFLNVSSADILDHIKQCWAALYSAKSLYYLQQKNLRPDLVKIAVIVQQMIPSRVAGVTYTSHPVNLSSDEMVIEAGFGLGGVESAREITPDTYTINKKSVKIIDKIVLDQTVETIINDEGGVLVQDREVEETPTQKLTDEEIIQLTDLSKKIEKFYKHPVAIEWLLDDDFHIVQARKM